MTSILGIASHYHDSAAAILIDGHVVAAAQEERFSRIKHDASMPCEAIEYCLREAGLSKSQIDYVAYYEKPIAKFERLLETYMEFSPFGYPFFRQSVPTWTQSKLHLQHSIRRALDNAYRKQIAFIEHHQSHAATAFYNSPFDQSAILTIDGVGEWTTTAIGYGIQNRISLTDDLNFPHSLGLLYSAFTAYLGFRVNDGEYKVMGLAPYGTPEFRKTILEDLIDLREDGSFRLRMKYFHFCHGSSMTNANFDRLFGGPSRKADEPLSDRHTNIAASIQNALEEIILKIAHTAYQRTHSKNLVMAGGVALNCVANSRVADEGPFKNVWIHGAAGDCGAAIGSAQYVWHQLLNHPRYSKSSNTGRALSNRPSLNLLLGPAFTDDEVTAALDDSRLKYQIFDDEQSLCEAVAKQIDAQKIVGWFQGRMEFGPRALGSRCILADARSPDMKETLNIRIKQRESFRPFAPAILAEHVETYFRIPGNTDCSSMTFVAHLKPTADSLCKFPSIIHRDGTSRLQTVNHLDNPTFHGLLTEFHRQTNCPLLISTSFNLRDEPIVCTPADAIRCFYTTRLDALCIGRFLVLREGQPKSELVSDLANQRSPIYDVSTSESETLVSKAALVARRLISLPVRIIAEAAMTAAYFGVFFPMGFCRRHLSPSKRLKLEVDAYAESYWKSRTDDKNSKSYFRQS